MNNQEVDSETQLLPFINVIEHDKKEYKVAKRFVITNGKISLEGVDNVELSTLEVVRMIRGDTVILEEKVRGLLKIILLSQKESNVTNSEVVT
jgi:hypothetical protein